MFWCYWSRLRRQRNFQLPRCPRRRYILWISSQGTSRFRNHHVPTTRCCQRPKRTPSWILQEPLYDYVLLKSWQSWLGVWFSRTLANQYLALVLRRDCPRDIILIHLWSVVPCNGHDYCMQDVWIASTAARSWPVIVAFKTHLWFSLAFQTSIGARSLLSSHLWLSIMGVVWWPNRRRAISSQFLDFQSLQTFSKGIGCPYQWNRDWSFGHLRMTLLQLRQLRPSTTCTGHLLSKHLDSWSWRHQKSAPLGLSWLWTAISRLYHLVSGLEICVARPNRSCIPSPRHVRLHPLRRLLPGSNQNRWLLKHVR